MRRPAALLRDRVVDRENVGHLAARVEDHRPVEPGDLAGAQSSLDGQQDHRAVAGGNGDFDALRSMRVSISGRDDFGLFAGHSRELLGLPLPDV